MFSSKTNRITNIKIANFYTPRSCRLAKEIVSVLKGDKIDQKVGVICPNGVSFVVAQWATWMTGNIFVPLSGKKQDYFWYISINII